MKPRMHQGAKGLPVISIADGASVGALSRIYVDPTQHMVVGFGADPPHAWNETERTYLVDAACVRSLGPDALLIDDRSALEGSTLERQLTELVDLEALVGRSVLTEEGEQLGKIASVWFNPQSFTIDSIEISSGFRDAMATIARERLVAVGPMIIVKAAGEMPTRVMDGDTEAVTP